MTLLTPTLDPAGSTLLAGGQPLLQLAPGWSAVADATGTGLFLRFAAADPAPYVVQPLGAVPGLQNFTSLHRFSPYWTRPAVGGSEAQVQPETLWMLARTSAQRYVMLVPLLDDASRYSLRAESGQLAVAGETGDPSVPCGGGVALHVAAGDDPYSLAAAGARAVQQFLGRGRLRADKAVPDFVDLFGWCTWDAFYKEVSPEKVEAGLASFSAVGVTPRLLILDDGWQQWQRAAGGEDRLTRLAPNARFGGSLAPLVATARERYGVKRVLAWHALMGYWGGLDPDSFPEYGTRMVPRWFGPGLLQQESRLNTWPWGAQAGVPEATRFAAFYDDWHTLLASQGVDGVKVDVQAALEALAIGQGGRVAYTAAARRALESSVLRHFDGRLINCMSVTSECAYLCTDSTVMRTSDDFFPRRPETHGGHLHVNALAGMWFGEFMLPDWDMFHSLHPQGALHAAARAISGGPVYVSDEVGRHDPALLRKLVLSDGSVLRADLPARPSPDCLMADPTREPALLKVFNRNGDRGVVGLFNVHADGLPIAGTAELRDLPVLDAQGEWVAWMHRHDRMWRCGKDPAPVLELAGSDWEIVAFAPVENGFAAFGLADKLNGGAAITARSWQDGSCQLALRDGGRFLAWSAQPPHHLHCDGVEVSFTHDATSGRLVADLPPGGPRTLAVRWA